MRRRGFGRGAIGAIALVALALVLAACSGPNNGQNSLRPKGKYAKQIDHLFVPIAFVAVAIGILVVGAVVYAAVKFRQRPGHPDNPKQVHGHTLIEVVWTVIPALIMVSIGVPTVSTIFSLSKEPKNPVVIEVVGKQWWWEFVYPAQGGEKQVVTADEMHIPTGRDVFLKLRSCDESLPGECNVIHSFWVPELAGKKDVVPGRENTMKLRADDVGTYLGQCAEYCGLSHANMRFRVIAQSPDDFDAWLSGQRDGPATPLTSGDEPAGDAQQLFSKRFGCVACHSVDKSNVSSYGPNLTHLASRTTFASGYYKLTRAKLIEWILDAPSLIPMESKDCRLGVGVPGVTCVGMPSFTKDTPPGKPVMTKAEAETIADYLLGLK